MTMSMHFDFQIPLADFTILPLQNEILLETLIVYSKHKLQLHHKSCCCTTQKGSPEDLLMASELQPQIAHWRAKQQHQNLSIKENLVPLKSKRKIRHIYKNNNNNNNSHAMVQIFNLTIFMSNFIFSYSYIYS